ncbi:unnamed protein product [Hydatigera taeniaeformis]|uniref:Nucleoporin GLE1 n=1 Tax=Hydatigena taeniaeformis TaxID=6205 RepID=A0A0R3XDK8_HYDTA|nr:unnamed protein product [Hydatigera taeniaeformis]
MTEEVPTFSEALRVQQQVHLLLNHLIAVVHGLEPATSESLFGPSEEALICWTLIVAILQLNKEAIINVFSLLLRKTDPVIIDGIAPPAPPSILPLLLRRILSGIEALERSLSTNSQANPEYSAFFTDLKPTIWCVWAKFHNFSGSICIKKL